MRIHLQARNRPFGMGWFVIYVALSLLAFSLGISVVNTDSFGTPEKQALVLTASAPSPSTPQIGGQSLPFTEENQAKKIQSYEAAKEREEQEAGFLMKAKELVRKVNALLNLHGDYKSKFESAQNSLKYLDRDLTQLHDVATQVEKEKRATIKDIEQYSQAAANAFNASTAYAKASQLNEPALAQTADATATTRVRVRSRAVQSLKTSQQSTRNLRSNLRSKWRRRGPHDDVDRMFSTVEDLIHQTQDSLTATQTYIAQTNSSSSLDTAITKILESIKQKPKVVKAVLANLAVPQDISKTLSAIGDQEHGAQLLDTLLQHSLDATIETEAAAFMASIRAASLETCPPENPCRNNLNWEREYWDHSVQIGKKMVEEDRRQALANAAATARLQKKLAGYLQMVAHDEKAIAILKKNMDETHKTITSGRDLAKEEQTLARERYDNAKAATEAAYMEAYGSLPSETVSVLPEAKAEAQLTLNSETLTLSSQMSPIDVEYHAYEVFTTRDEESDTFGAYTYVILRHWVGNPSLTKHIKQRYQALLNAIITTTPHLPDVIKDYDHEKINLFFIPSKIKTSKTTEHIKLANYDNKLAWTYFARANKIVSRRKDILRQLDSAGPFLLTTAKPIRNVKTNSPTLFVDLSEFPASAYEDILKGYKRSLVETPPTSLAIWKPPKMTQILLKGLQAEVHIQQLHSMVSSWVGGGGGAGSVKTFVQWFLPRQGQLQDHTLQFVALP